MNPLDCIIWKMNPTLHAVLSLGRKAAKYAGGRVARTARHLGTKAAISAARAKEGWKLGGQVKGGLTGRVGGAVMGATQQGSHIASSAGASLARKKALKEAMYSGHDFARKLHSSEVGNEILARAAMKATGKQAIKRTAQGAGIVAAANIAENRRIRAKNKQMSKSLCKRLMAVEENKAEANKKTDKLQERLYGNEAYGIPHQHQQFQGQKYKSPGETYGPIDYEGERSGGGLRHFNSSDPTNRITRTNKVQTKKALKTKRSTLGR